VHCRTCVSNNVLHSVGAEASGDCVWAGSLTSMEVASRQACSIKKDEELKYEMVRNEVNMNNSVEWSYLKCL
jgi:hypothetical protein